MRADRILNRPGDAGKRRKMENDLDAFHGPRSNSGVGEIASVDFGIVSHLGEVLESAGGKIVDYSDRMPVREQPPDHMRADETGAAGYQSLHLVEAVNVQRQ